jgi:DNA-binding MltR family transcriptional regulator
MTEKEQQSLSQEQLVEDILSEIKPLNNDSAQYIQETVARALEKVGMSHIEVPKEVVQLRLSLGKETDRGCALLAASYIETALGHLIQSVLLEDKNLIKDMFTGTGPLATFSSRINMAYLLGLIGRKAMGDLHIIRKIRNDFAHKPEDIKFTDEPIASRCRELHHGFLEETPPPRKKFMHVSLGVVGVIHGVTKHGKRPVMPSDVDIQRTGEGFKKLMEAVEMQRNEIHSDLSTAE